MPIVKCTACGKHGYEFPPKLNGRELASLKWLKQRMCRHCGKKTLVRAKFGVDYGFDEKGERFGDEGLNVESADTKAMAGRHRTSNVE